MKTKISMLLLAVALSGCAGKRAAADCESMGYSPGTARFQQCAERQVVARRAYIMEYQRQKNEIAVECEKSSHSALFGRNTGRTDCPN
jgi:hypothetical protein